jgi:hypothetical protein
VPLPADKSLYYQTKGQLIGCNRLYCDACGSYVKVFSGYKRWGAPTSADEMVRYYESDNPAEWSFLHGGDVGKSFRVYRCRCDTMDTAGFRKAPELDQGWHCAGHPQP